MATEWTNGIQFPEEAGIFLSMIISKLALGLIQHSIQWVPGDLSWE
jgi:hypothetical protein